MIDPDPRSFATLCYGVTDRSWVNVTEINVTSGVVHWPLERCKTDEDCSLNGEPLYLAAMSKGSSQLGVGDVVADSF